MASLLLLSCVYILVLPIFVVEDLFADLIENLRFVFCVIRQSMGKD
jgi:hypothetical protein